MLNNKALAASASAPPAIYPEDVFQTYLYTGTGSAQTINNGIDESGKGALTWLKTRSAATNHYLIDTARGNTKLLNSNTTSAEDTAGSFITAFNSNGFSLGTNSEINSSGSTYCSWTFAEQPKFFDIVTYTGNGTYGRTVAHNLGSTPGMVIVKSTSQPYDWYVWHRSLTSGHNLKLNTTEASSSGIEIIIGASSTNFTLNQYGGGNGSGDSYVAYLFAHDAGGFGAAGTDNVISCGSYTGNGSTTGPVINLGYEPQFVMAKAASTTGDWFMVDTMRGQGVGSSTSNQLKANTSDAEDLSNFIAINATGFQITASVSDKNGSGQTFIYMAIRRPMKTPTSGTQVFAPVEQGFDGFVNTGFVTDLIFGKQFTSGNSWRWVDRLRGGDKSLNSDTTSAESTETFWKFDSNTGVNLTYGGTIANWIWSNFRRAPGFFDVVCYTGTGANGQVINHNLTVIPEMLIIKARNGNQNWFVYQTGLSSGNSIFLNLTSAQSNDGGPAFSLSSTALTIDRTYVSNLNSSGATYVAYLFATLAGISKVGSYTGTAATQTINAGLPTGARFVFIKRTDSTGEWWIWNTVRGMVSGTDPRLALNSTAAESNNDWVLTATNGFQIVTSDTTVNASGGTYIYLAIA